MSEMKKLSSREESKKFDTCDNNYQTEEEIAVGNYNNLVETKRKI